MLPPSNLKPEFLDSPLPASGVSVANELADCLRFVWTLNKQMNSTNNILIKLIQYTVTKHYSIGKMYSPSFRIY